jgi:hypothetical protein
MRPDGGTPLGPLRRGQGGNRPPPRPATDTRKTTRPVPTFTNITFETIRIIRADLTAPEPMRFQALDETLAVEAITVTFDPPGSQIARWSAHGPRSSDGMPARIDYEAGQEPRCPPRLLTLITELIGADEPARAAGHLHSH